MSTGAFRVAVRWDGPQGSFVGSHPIQFIVYGAGEKSAVCP
jgi:hypothetical protein